jgi:hypothetical protein
MSNLPFAMPVTRRSTVLLAAILALGACSSTTSAPSATSPSGGSPGSSPSPAASAPPSSGPTVGAIDHKTGATDVLLRIEQGGGFVPMEFNASQAPGFTLYGNGVIVFKPADKVFPEPDGNGVLRYTPWRTGTLDEGQVQELLEFALTNGGLGTARDTYMSGGIADAPSTIFTIHAGGIDKTVAVNALSEEQQPGPDSLARKAFFQLAKRLQDFDQGGTISSDVYSPDRFRGVIFERDAQPGVGTVDWPWPALTPTDFKEGPPDGSAPMFPHRTLTPDEIAALKLTDIDGGIQGLVLKAPDKKLYTFILRPLLVDEKE